MDTFKHDDKRPPNTQSSLYIRGPDVLERALAVCRETGVDRHILEIWRNHFMDVHPDHVDLPLLNIQEDWLDVQSDKEAKRKIAKQIQLDEKAERQQQPAAQPTAPPQH